MPNYYNPYSFYPVGYANQMGYNNGPQANYSGAPVQRKYLEWVEGEVGAKAFQMPPDLAPNQPIPLWDSTDTVIYIKSWGPMGIPNPMQKLRYEMPEQPNHHMNLASGSNDRQNPDMSQYVTKEELNQIREEMQNALSGSNGNSRKSGQQNNSYNENNQNGSSGNNNSGNNNRNSGNRGGNW